MKKLLDKYINHLYYDSFNRYFLIDEYNDLIAKNNFILLKERILLEYKKNDSFYDALSKTAILFFEKKYTSEAMDLFHIDIFQNKATWWGMLRYAEHLFLIGKEESAINCIKETYKTEKNACNGYASIGWKIRDNNTRKSLYLFYQEIKENRLSNGFKINYAVILYREKRKNESITEIKKAYDNNKELKDGFYRIAEYEDNEKVRLTLMERDFELRRLSSENIYNLSAIYLKLKKYKKYLKVTKLLYNNYSQYKDLYKKLGEKIYINESNHNKLIRLIGKDINAGNASAQTYIVLAINYAKNGNLEESKKIISNLYNIFPDYKNGHIKVAKEIFFKTRKFKEFIALSDLDIKNYRYTTRSLLLISKAKFSTGYHKIAIELIEEIYEKDKFIKDQYCLLVDFILKHQGFSKNLVNLALKDKAKKRLSSKGVLILARLLVYNNQVNESLCLINEHNKKYNDLMSVIIDSLTKIGKLEEVIKLALNSADEKSKISILDNNVSSAISIRNTCFKSTLSKQFNIFKTYTNLVKRHFYKKYGTHFNINNHKIKAVYGANLPLQFYEIFVCDNYYFESDNNKPLIIDCGSNFGLSLIYFKSLFPNSIIEAYEPNPYVFNYLKDNIKENKMKNITLIPKAITSKKEIKNIIYCQDNLMSSTLSERIHHTLPFSKTEKLNIQTNSLRCALKGRYIDYLKMDIEGSETEAITSSKDFFLKIKQGFIEYHYDYDTENNNLSEIINFFEKNHFYYQITNQNSIENHYFPHTNFTYNKPWSLSIIFKNQSLS